MQDSLEAGVKNIEINMIRIKLEENPETPIEKR